MFNYTSDIEFLLYDNLFLFLRPLALTINYVINYFRARIIFLLKSWVATSD